MWFWFEQLYWSIVLSLRMPPAMDVMWPLLILSLKVQTSTFLFIVSVNWNVFSIIIIVFVIRLITNYILTLHSPSPHQGCSKLHPICPQRRHDIVHLCSLWRPPPDHLVVQRWLSSDNRRRGTLGNNPDKCGWFRWFRSCNRKCANHTKCGGGRRWLLWLQGPQHSRRDRVDQSIPLDTHSHSRNPWWWVQCTLLIIFSQNNL